MSTYKKQAEKNIESRKLKAEFLCEETLSRLRQDSEFAEIDKNIKRLRVDIGLSRDNEKISALRKELNSYLAQLQQYLSKHNLCEKDLVPQYTCKKCNDTGYTIDGECQCLRVETKQLVLQNSDFVHKTCTFATNKETNTHNNDVIAVCKKITTANFTGKIRNIVLTGKTGTGKTYLCSAIANQLLDNGTEIAFITAYNLNQQFLKCHLADLQLKQLYMDSFVDTDCLIIDDLGTESILKKVTLEYLFAVLNERKQQNKITIISTNLTPEEIQERYDDRVFSRIFDKENTFIAELIGTDKRILG